MVPSLEPPLLGRVVAQAQAMGRPVVTADVGIPEHMVTPPEMPEDVRTGWVAKPGDPVEIARALGVALSLDARAYRAMAARARQFAEYMFSPDSVAAATREVYTSLLARDTRAGWLAWYLARSARAKPAVGNPTPGRDRRWPGRHGGPMLGNAARFTGS